MTDIYKKLAKHLDNLPGGFPETESGVELRILKKLFTPREAEIAPGLVMMPEPVSAIANRLNMDENTLAPILEQMAKKGLIIRQTRGGTTTYMAAQFVIGIWEYHVNDLDEELIRLFNEYVPHLMEKVWTKQKTKQLRVIPISQSMTPEMNIMAYDMAEKLVREQSKIVVAPCICRKERNMLDEGCDRIQDACLVFAGGAYFYEENELGRTISQDEAVNILKEAEKAGLVLQPGNSQKPMNICLCCGCCCQILRNLKTMPEPAEYVNTSYYVEVDEDECTACGVCEDRCQMDAISIDDVSSVDLTRCIGCGLCVSTCETGALRLVKKEADEVWEPPQNIIETYMTIARERGLM